MAGLNFKTFLLPSGFAISLNLLLSNPVARFNPYAKEGHLESSFLIQVITMDEVEAKADNCNQVMFLPCIYVADINFMGTKCDRNFSSKGV